MDETADVIFFGEINDCVEGATDSTVVVLKEGHDEVLGILVMEVLDKHVLFVFIVDIRHVSEWSFDAALKSRVGVESRTTGRLRESGSQQRKRKAKTGLFESPVVK